MRAWAILLFVALAGCDDPSPSQSTDTQSVRYDSIQAVAGGPSEQIAFSLVEKPEMLDAVAKQVRNEGYECDSVADLWSLQFKKDVGMKIWKAHCANGFDYQLTLFDNKGFVKPWTGHLMGS